jgi:hypothetical protein
MLRTRAAMVIILILAVAVHSSPMRAQSADGAAPSRLSPQSMEIAGELGIARDLRERKVQNPADQAALIRSLLDRQEVLEQLLLASLEIDKANASTDAELERMRTVREDLSARRDRAQGKINLATLVAGALGTVGTSLQFRSSTVNLGNGIGVAGGSASVILSIAGMHEQGGRQLLGPSPRMLEVLLGHAANDPASSSEGFPRIVWDYLNAAPPDAPPAQTRRQQLIAKWRVEGKLGTDDAAGVPSAAASIPGAAHPLRRELSIDDLNGHYAMLLDLKATISQMKQALSELAESVAEDSASTTGDSATR